MRRRTGSINLDIKIFSLDLIDEHRGGHFRPAVKEEVDGYRQMETSNHSGYALERARGSGTHSKGWERSIGLQISLTRSHPSNFQDLSHSLLAGRLYWLNKLERQRHLLSCLPPGAEPSHIDYHPTAVDPSTWRTCLVSLSSEPQALLTPRTLQMRPNTRLAEGLQLCRVCGQRSLTPPL
ncbi:hypothetical protein BJX63DRAFT_63623 [Aspergillus granulosus]|uniref:Uncharacterized protein n=1 Tax=Aspergillus granulosus TaxID=176169 RepID=A0ABR4GWU8_9EURO